MKDSLKQISCDPECGFMVRSHEEQEVVKMAHDHVKSVHHKDVSANDLKGMMVDA